MCWLGETMKYYCQFSNHIGSNCQNPKTMYYDSMYSLVGYDENACIGIRQLDLEHTFEFETEIELNNFIAYMKTKFARFCVALYKNRTNINSGETTLVPYLDFKQSWDDKKLFNHFNIDDATQQYIIDFIPNFYDM